ncbi:MAG TPA: PAS domain-containing protein [Puia sp.]|uniref:PAS domain-containing sensor histidine kinase n=1 Tax=Puia sp. TaxID=2045100 RepID=UPI002B571AF7|nr:PAS domain-containing protein [Puia sp.]HVU96330.1 PAS domain-containing protein [Puia sp.]
MAYYIADTVNAMLAYWDTGLMCRFANKSYSDWFGVSKEAMVNKMTLPQLLGPELFEKNRPFVMAALQGKVQTFERDIRMPTGEIRNSIATYYPDNEHGAVQGIIVHVADVTPIRKMQAAEKKLFESRELFQQFMENSPTPAWITDQDGIMEYVNNAFLKVFNCREDIIGKSIREIFPSQPTEEYIKNNRMALQTGTTVESIETFVDVNKVTRWFKSTKFPLRYKDTIMIAAWAMDITSEVFAHETRLQFEQEKRREVLRSVIEAQETEKERLSKRLHEQTAQTLSSCKLILDSLMDDGSGEPLLKLADANLGAAIEELRLTCNLLTPMTLLDLGLKEAIKETAIEIHERFKTRPRLSFIGKSFEDIATQDKLNTFRIVGDMLEFLCQYMNAASIALELRITGIDILVHIRYAGLGFGGNTRGKEMQSIHNRIEYCNGTIEWSNSGDDRQHVLIHIRGTSAAK